MRLRLGNLANMFQCRPVYCQVMPALPGRCNSACKTTCPGWWCKSLYIYISKRNMYTVRRLVSVNPYICSGAPSDFRKVLRHPVHVPLVCHETERKQLVVQFCSLSSASHLSPFQSMSYHTRIVPDLKPNPPCLLGRPVRINKEIHCRYEHQIAMNFVVRQYFNGNGLGTIHNTA